MNSAEAVLRGGGPILTNFGTQVHAVCQCSARKNPGRH